jgi:hypothetical protein
MRRRASSGSRSGVTRASDHLSPAQSPELGLTADRSAIKDAMNDIDQGASLPSTEKRLRRWITLPRLLDEGTPSYRTLTFGVSDHNRTHHQHLTRAGRRE